MSTYWLLKEKNVFFFFLICPFFPPYFFFLFSHYPGYAKYRDVLSFRHVRFLWYAESGTDICYPGPGLGHLYNEIFAASAAVRLSIRDVRWQMEESARIDDFMWVYVMPRRQPRPLQDGRRHWRHAPTSRPDVTTGTTDVTTTASPPTSRGNCRAAHLPESFPVGAASRSRLARQVVPV
jgi:hypothetical protein